MTKKKTTTKKTTSSVSEADIAMVCRVLSAMDPNGDTVEYDMESEAFYIGEIMTFTRAEAIERIAATMGELRDTEPPLSEVVALAERFVRWLEGGGA